VCCVLCVVCGLFNACAFCLKAKPRRPGGCVGINCPSYLVSRRNIYRHAQIGPTPIQNHCFVCSRTSNFRLFQATLRCAGMECLPHKSSDGRSQLQEGKVSRARVSSSCVRLANISPEWNRGTKKRTSDDGKRGADEPSAGSGAREGTGTGNGTGAATVGRWDAGTSTGTGRGWARVLAHGRARIRARARARLF
jgi:hypothetical protein